jgi:hypothetical protein
MALARWLLTAPALMLIAVAACSSDRPMTAPALADSR